MFYSQAAYFSREGNDEKPCRYIELFIKACQMYTSIPVINNRPFSSPIDEFSMALARGEKLSTYLRKSVFPEIQ